MRAVIVEDEPLARRRLRRLIRSIPDVEIVGEAADAETALRVLGESEPDVVFLDIEMPGMSGLQLVEGMDTSPAIVFVTAYERYAVRAFEVEAADYLVKPVSRARLEEALQRARRRAAAEGDADVVLYHRVGSRRRALPSSTVEYFEARGDYVAAWKADSYALLGTTLKELENRLPESRFLRIHRSIIVNRDYVREVGPRRGGRLGLTMSSGKTVIASRRRTPETRAWLG